jgi:Protein of unknown function with HXXEE motif
MCLLQHRQTQPVHFWIGLLGRTTVGVAYCLMITAVMCANGFWHLWGSYKSRGYSPGVGTGVIGYVPLAVYGYAKFVRSGAAAIGIALVAGIIGGSYHLWLIPEFRTHC